MYINRTIFSIFSFLLLMTHLWGQEPPANFNFVSTKDGISKTAVSTIIQDHNGFIWIGTNGAGIHRYDGIEYISYPDTSKDSVSINSSMIFCTYLDKKNRLWVGTESGLSLYDRGQDRFKNISLTKDADNGFNNHMAVSSITEDHEGNLFVSVFEKGLFKLDTEDFEAHHIPNIGFSTTSKTGILNIYTLKTDRKGKVYAGTNVGLKEYDPDTQTLKPSLFLSNNDSQTIQKPIQSLFISEENNIWIGSLSSGLYKVDRQEEDIEILHLPITSKRILSLAVASDGTILCGTENDGLFHIDKTGNVIKNYLFDKKDDSSIRSNSIWSLFLDKNDRIWMGYYNSGIGVYDKLYDKFEQIESLPSIANSLEASAVTGIVQDQKNRFWMSMDGGGIDIYDPQTSTFKHIHTKSTDFGGLTSNDIQAIYFDSKENLWVGSWNSGIFLLKKGSQQFINFNPTNTDGVLTTNSVLSFSEDSNGKIWIGTFYGGLLSYDYDSNKITHHNSKVFMQQNIHTSSIRKVLVDHNDHIWVGATTGLFKVVPEEQNTYSIVSIRQKMSPKNQNSLNANHILSIYESSDHIIWIGTRGQGLCRYDENQNAFTWYNQQNGLQEENVSAIIEDQDGHIWVSGNQGIHKLDVQTNKVSGYNVNDGLLSNDYNFNAVHRDEFGNLYFGNYKGIDYFNPRNIKINTSTPNLYLTGFKLFNKNVVPSEKDSPLKQVISETDSISLTHTQSVFTIEYAGVNYTRPEKNQYAYYLKGLEESWNYVGNMRSATYTNLDYGNYTFKVKVANNDGVWNETPLELKITILPPWWKTNWAIAAYALLFLLGVYLLNTLTQNRIKEKQLIENEREKRIKEEELNNKKLQFFTNISHEFRTPLTLIINPIIDIINSKKYQFPDEIREKHLVIHKNTDRLSRLINELMDFRKLEMNKLRVKAQRVDIIDFVAEVVSYFKQEAHHKNISLGVEHNLDTLEGWVDKSMMEKIIFNLLSNAFKVTPEGGNILIEIYSNTLESEENTGQQNTFEICISDTGPGLKKEQLDKIFERFYQVNNLNKWYYGGTGIGLEVVRGLVKLHKGNIQVDSEVGKGTTFKVVLPLGNSHFQEDEMILSKSVEDKPKIENIVLSVPKELKEEKKQEVKEHRLLIVEDNTELRNYLKRELTNRYKIFTASNGAEGLEKAKNEIPDIIITDVIMPEMDGFDFCAAIKNDIQTSHIPLLMLTAKTMHEDRLKGIESGADAYLSKPFDLRVLKSRLSQLLTSRQLLFNKYFSAIVDNDIETNTTSLDKDFIEKVLNYINENINDPDLGVESLAYQLNLSRSQFYRKIKTLTGQTANQFLRNIRLQRAKQILERGHNNNISEVCYQVGFSSPSYFTKCFRNHFGILPTEVETEQS